MIKIEIHEKNLLILCEISFRCIERLLDNWDALKVYFKSQTDLQDLKKKPMPTKPSVKDSSSSKKSVDNRNVSVDSGKLKHDSKKETASSMVMLKEV